MYSSCVVSKVVVGQCVVIIINYHIQYKAALLHVLANKMSNGSVGPMEMTWETIGERCNQNLDEVLCGYLLAGVELSAGQRMIHLSTDKASIGGLGLQNTMLSLHTGHGILCCTQACQNIHG